MRPRVPALVRGAGARAVAVTCILVALALPFPEFIPFSANLAGAALTAFGLSLVTGDGVLALIAYAATAAVAGVGLYNLL